MAMALRPRASAASMSSWKGSQALADGLRVGCGWLCVGPESVAEPAVTGMAALAGARSVIASLAGFAASESVVTSMAGFAVVRPPGLPGGRYRNAGRFKIRCRRLTAYPCFTLNAPPTPAELAQSDDLLLLFFAQNIAHFDGA
jgi:hypothetical protein